MDFASDNRSGAAPAVVDALVAEAARFGGAYGDDHATAELDRLLADVFERPVRAYPVLTGTAANSLALACLTTPWGGIACHDDAHVLVDESGAPEFYGGGSRLVAVPGAHGRIDPAALAEVLAQAGAHDVHTTPLEALSITQATEAGTTYAPDAIAELAELAHAHGCPVHLDGARLANAVVGTGASPADLTWRAGIDVAVLGGTKNGAVGVEAVVFFDADRADTFERRRKRGGHLASKTRFLSCQLEALLRDGEWLRLAAAANDAARRLATGLEALAVDADLRIVHPVDANMVFVEASNDAAAAWRAGGAAFYDVAGPHRSTVRLVTSWSTTNHDVDSFVALVGAGATR